jgi:hypothetical protein
MWHFLLVDSGAMAQYEQELIAANMTRGSSQVCTSPGGCSLHMYPIDEIIAAGDDWTTRWFFACVWAMKLIATRGRSLEGAGGDTEDVGLVFFYLACLLIALGFNAAFLVRPARVELAISWPRARSLPIRR